MTITTVTNRVKILKEKFTQSLGLPFQNLLPESEIQKVMDELKIKYRQRLFDPNAHVVGFFISSFRAG
jgi:hypothetical protein